MAAGPGLPREPPSHFMSILDIGMVSALFYPKRQEITMGGRTPGRHYPVAQIEQMCYYRLGKYRKGENMRLLRLAVESQRWDLAACTIVLATAKLLKGGERYNGGKHGAKKGKRYQAERPEA